MKTISIQNSYHPSSNKLNVRNNTNFKGYAVTDDGNLYKQSNIGKYTLTSVSLALTLFFIISAIIGIKSPKLRLDCIKRTLTDRLVNTFSAFGIGTIIDLLINKVRANRADKKAVEIFAPDNLKPQGHTVIPYNQAYVPQKISL